MDNYMSHMFLTMIMALHFHFRKLRPVRVTSTGWQRIFSISMKTNQRFWSLRPREKVKKLMLPRSTWVSNSSSAKTLVWSLTYDDGWSYRKHLSPAIYKTTQECYYTSIQNLWNSNLHIHKVAVRLYEFPAMLYSIPKQMNNRLQVVQNMAKNRPKDIFLNYDSNFQDHSWSCAMYLEELVKLRTKNRFLRSMGTIIFLATRASMPNHMDPF